LLLVAASVALAEDLRTFTNSEFQFSFQYPPSWQVRPPGSPHSRGKVVSPNGSPSAECAVIVKRFPQLSSLSQMEIDQVFAQQPTPSEFREALSQGFNDVTVMTVSIGALHTRPAQLARVQYSVGTEFGKVYVSGRMVMTATPGLSWAVTCGGQGRTFEEAARNYLHWQAAINSIVFSFQFR
jgi:hypothetical protein